MQLTQMRSLRHLDIEGLKSICQMCQLRAFDIWNLDMDVSALDLLTSLEHLEYLSIGGWEGQTTFKAETVLPKLRALPSLKRLWLDGIVLTDLQAVELRHRYDHVQIT